MMIGFLLLIALLVLGYFVIKADAKHMERVQEINAKDNKKWETDLVQKITARVLENMEKKGKTNG